MEAQRWRLAMFASCGWFWDDRPASRRAGVLRAAARAVRLIDGLAGTDLERRLIDDLRLIESDGVEARRCSIALGGWAPGVGASPRGSPRGVLTPPRRPRADSR